MLLPIKPKEFRVPFASFIPNQSTSIESLKITFLKNQTHRRRSTPHCQNASEMQGTLFKINLIL